MATVSMNVLVLAGGFDLSCYLPSIEASGEVEMLDNTTLCNTGTKTYQPGLKEFAVKGESFFAYDGTTDANSIDKTFADALGASAVDKQFLIAPNGYSAIGDPCLIFNTKQASYSIKETVGELIKLDFDTKASGGSAAGSAAAALILMRTTATTTGAATSVDNAGTSVGYLAQCHITEADTLTNITVKVQHSTDNSTFADLCTFTTFTANGSEQKTATTTVNRYRRANVTGFTGTSARVTVALKSPFAI